MMLWHDTFIRDERVTLPVAGHEATATTPTGLLPFLRTR